MLLVTQYIEVRAANMKTYVSLKSSLSVHPVYIVNDATIQDYLRTVFTRCRLSSHKLKIETGRWACIDPEERLCICGSIQTEEHVLLDCVLTSHIRDMYFSTIKFPISISAMFEAIKTPEDFKMIYVTMRYFE